MDAGGDVLIDFGGDRLGEQWVTLDKSEAEEGNLSLSGCVSFVVFCFVLFVLFV